MIYRNSNPPTKKNDQQTGYMIGDLWIQTTTGRWWRCQSNGQFDAIWSQVSLSPGTYGSGLVLMQGSIAVTSAAGVPLIARAKDQKVSLPCARIWFGAPVMPVQVFGGGEVKHNRGPVWIGLEMGEKETGNKLPFAGGRPLMPDNFSGFDYPVLDAGEVMLYGAFDGDIVAFQIFST